MYVITILLCECRNVRHCSVFLTATLYLCIGLHLNQIYANTTTKHFPRILPYRMLPDILYNSFSKTFCYNSTFLATLMLASKHCMTSPIPGPCHQALQMLSDTNPIFGIFTPICEEDGYYSPHQFYSVSGESWCVTRDGKEIENTRTSRGEPPKDCSQGTVIYVRTSTCL